MNGSGAYRRQSHVDVARSRPRVLSENHDREVTPNLRLLLVQMLTELVSQLLRETIVQMCLVVNSSRLNKEPKEKHE